MKKNKQEILVTVILPTYNSMPFLKESIESILNQTYKNFELIIVENGSNDGSKELCRFYKTKDKRIKIIYFDKPLGFAGEKASNIAIKEAKGKYIARMDADDISEKNRIKKEVDFLDSNEDIFLVGSWGKIIDENNKEIGIRKLPTKSVDIYKNFYLKNCIMNPSVMFRNKFDGKDFFTLDERFSSMNDYHSYFLMQNSGLKFSNIPEFLIKYRIHNKNATFTNLKLKFKQNILIKDSFVKDFDYSPPFIHRLIVRIQYFLIMLIPQKIISYVYLNFVWNK